MVQCKSRRGICKHCQYHNITVPNADCAMTMTPTCFKTYKYENTLIRPYKSCFFFFFFFFFFFVCCFFFVCFVLLFVVFCARKKVLLYKSAACSPEVYYIVQMDYVRYFRLWIWTRHSTSLGPSKIYGMHVNMGTLPSLSRRLN